MTNKEIANTILQQLGGNKFIVMTGAKNFIVIENGLEFSIGRNGSQANTVRIVLDWDDTYSMSFIKRGRPVNEYNILMKYADKGLSPDEYNEIVGKAIKRAKEAAQPKTLKEYHGLFFDQLQEFFTEYTKLYTHL